MADQTESCTVIAASPAEVMRVIADFPAYPEWAGAVKEAEVLEPGVDGRARQVRFRLDAGVIRDEYVLMYDWQDDAVSWNLVRAGLLTAMSGSYTLAASGGGTEVTYRLAVNVRVPMIGLLKRKAEKAIIDTALKELKKRVEG